MKKIILSTIIIVSLLVTVGIVFAAKPAGNIAGAIKIPWNLSGEVMPSPPWGLSDIPGSDTASKLIVNQPNGNTKVAITGIMKGLNPNTIYTVYPSNTWLTSEEWNISGVWELKFMYNNKPYDHQMTVAFQNMHTGAFSGTGFSHTDGSTWDIVGTSNVTGNTITLDLIYTGNSSGYTVHAVGTIDDTSGKITSGDWSSSAGQSGTWSSIAGQAEEETVGDGYPKLFNTQKTFTFMTDEYGAGSWHLNLKDADFPVPSTYNFSVWINDNSIPATILISDNFTVEVD